MALALDELPDCTAQSTPNRDWQWRDPTAAGAQPMLGDHSGDWASGQLIAPSADAASQPTWLARLQSWRAGCLRPLGIDYTVPPTSALVSSRLFELPELQWTQHALVHVQMHPYDRLFFDPETGEYTIDKWLADLEERFGGIDAALIWPTYPQLGVDDRNAYDMITSLPGGLEGIRSVVRQLHARGVKVLWPFMPWDTSTRYAGAEPNQMLELVRDTGADGINGDTLYTMPTPFWDAQVASNGPYVALQAELGGTLSSLKYTTLGWGEAGAWSLDLKSSLAPSVDLFKWLQPRRMTTICRRWDKDRNDALQHAWFNGIGYVAWENVWGIWNGFTERDGQALKRIQPLMRYMASMGLLNSEGWEPHARTAQPDAIFASRFPQSRRWGPFANGAHNRSADGRQSAPPPCSAWTAWTLVERSGQAWPAGTPILRLNADSFAGCGFFDVYHGKRIQPSLGAAPGSGDMVLELQLPIEASGFGAVLAMPEATATAVEASRVLVLMASTAHGEYEEAKGEGDDAAARRLAEVLVRQEAMTSGRPLSTYSGEWKPAQQVRMSHGPKDGGDINHAAREADTGSTSAAASLPASHGAVLVPGTDAFDFRCHGMVIEPFDAESRETFGIDVQFPWEPFPRNEHSNPRLPVPSFYMDGAPVGNARFAAFIAATGYAPADTRGFLREWPDWRAGRYPDGNATVPTTGVSLDEARLFCRWAGGRLPTSVEWQYAAQVGDPSMLYPWGAEDDESKRPARVHHGRTPAPADSEAYRREGGANALGIYDLVGNVWQYTEDEYADEHTRFVLLRGGSRYQPRAASDFQNWYFASEDPDARPGGATRLDRHAKYFLMGASYERAATVGFRCAYDPPSDAEAGVGARGGTGDDGDGLASSTAYLVLGLIAAVPLVLCGRRMAKRRLAKARSTTRGVELGDVDAHGNDDDL